MCTIPSILYTVRLQLVVEEFDCDTWKCLLFIKRFLHSPHLDMTIFFLVPIWRIINHLHQWCRPHNRGREIYSMEDQGTLVPTEMEIAVFHIPFGISPSCVRSKVRENRSGPPMTRCLVFTMPLRQKGATKLSRPSLTKNRCTHSSRKSYNCKKDTNAFQYLLQPDGERAKRISDWPKTQVIGSCLESVGIGSLP